MIYLLNALTVDVEDWYQTHDLNINPDLWDSLEGRVEQSTARLLNLLSRHGVRATFFILGYIAGRHPRLVRQIAEAGHEIGSHGCMHCMVCRQTRDEFREDIVKSKKVLEDITGEEVKIYRAPSWSISRESLWALEILEEEGFVCDSSIQPFKTPLSGIGGAPVFPYHPVVRGRRLNILEFPPTVYQLGGLRLPFAGGLYFRALPRWIIRAALDRVNKAGPGMVYIHPWEIDPGQPRLNVSPVVRVTHYLGLDRTAEKLEDILGRFRFVPLGQLSSRGHYPPAPVFNVSGE